VRPNPTNGLFAKFALAQPQAGGLVNLRRHAPGVPQSIDASKQIWNGADQLRQRTEFAQQRLGEQLGVAARDGQRGQIFDELMVGHAVHVTVKQATAPTCAVPGVIGRGIGGVGIGHRARITAL
jgi:hypothetical protein